MALLAPMLAACAGTDPDPSTPAPAEPEQASGQVQVLAKAEGWRDGLTDSLEGEEPYALVEIAFDQAAAELAWEENVPADLDERSGSPTEPGVYGILDQVDFDTHAVVVWSSGQSGSCPSWLDGITTDAEGAVSVTTGQEETTCTDDYNQYRMVVAVPADALPEASWLPIEELLVNGQDLEWGSLIRDYPASD